MARVRELRRLDLQTKIILVLASVIIPTFLAAVFIQYKLTQPILESEMRQMAITTAQALATKIISQRWLSKAATWKNIENEIQEQLYLQPNIVRADVFSKDPASGLVALVASNVEDDPAHPRAQPPLIDKITSEFHSTDDGSSFWEILVPIVKPVPSGARTGKPVGLVSVTLSMRSVNRLMENYWKITGTAALVSVITLLLALNYFLRKTIWNERKLRVAENANLQLSQRLHEAQRQLMNVEKLAVIGQLTANFAHEIGTPLNAIGGHLQLLKDEVFTARNPAEPVSARSAERVEIISGELQRIEEIVRSFLQTSGKPVSQRQLVDLNSLVDKTVEIVRPRLDGMQVDLQCTLDRKIGPLRVVPLDIEQILLNLFNNSLDSLQSKSKKSISRLRLMVKTEMLRSDSQEWATLTVYDSGVGIAKADLKNVMKPFFTTKSPGEGTGLGLTICRQLVSKYEGDLELNSREGSWARVKLRIPYQTNV